VIKSAICLIVSAIVAAPVGCDQNQSQQTQPASALPTVKMKIGSRTYELEIARTPAEQEKGLMKRDSMPADHGMIFVFTKEEVLRFWMKDTRFPLDILFLDHGGRVVLVAQMKPYDLSETTSEKPAQYAIELNAGQANQAGVKTGQVLEIPTGARSAK
jgi:uncharacterized membrane protein (UPF0127 family)